MTKKENQELCEKYPFLLPRNVWTDELADDYDFSYIKGIGEIPKGWNKLFLQMCDDIRQPLIEANYLEKFRFSEIKEKYGTLRAYYFGAPESVARIIDKYEHISFYVCQSCGEPATKQTEGWIATFCNKCCPEYVGAIIEQKTVVEPIEFDPIMRITTYKDNKVCVEKIDCADIWERLYANTNKKN